MRALYLATVANPVMPAPAPRSCRRSSTLRSESGKRTYSITAKRMISGLVLKYLNGERFVIRRGYETTLPVSSSFCLTVPYTFQKDGIWYFSSRVPADLRRHYWTGRIAYSLRTKSIRDARVRAMNDAAKLLTYIARI